MAAKKPLPKRSKKVDSIDLYELVLQGMQSIDPVDRDAADSLRSLLVLQLKSPNTSNFYLNLMLHSRRVCND